MEMKSKSIPTIAIIVVSLSVLASMALAQQDKFALKSPNGIAFSEFKGYETWSDVAVSQTNDAIKAILANPVMIKAYQEGIPGNGKPFPDGSMIVKIAWNKQKNPVSPYFVNVPAALQSVAFIEKDSKRFPDSSGWGYAELVYDAPSKTFKPYGNDASFGTKICYQCHTLVKEKDYIFTAYPLR